MLKSKLKNTTAMLLASEKELQNTKAMLLASEKELQNTKAMLLASEKKLTEQLQVIVGILEFVNKNFYSNDLTNCIAKYKEAIKSLNSKVIEG
jgi:hypothetical protein